MLALSCDEKELRGRLLKNESMASYTSFQTGGVADYLYRPKDISDICFFLSNLDPKVPVTWLGLGSNTLIMDDGIEGVVICVRNGFNSIKMIEENGIVAESGVTCAKLSKFAIDFSLAGAEFFSGIPGTVGGALAMNAGAFGKETWAAVESVDLLDRQGNTRRLKSSEIKVGYREVDLPEGHWFISAVFRFSKNKESNGRRKVRSLLDKRNSSQPIGVPSFGSVFKNPDGSSAGRLIEMAGLKGKKVGGAYVSDVHANFILNDGTATSSDALELINCIRNRVQKYHGGITLEPEVRLLGRVP